MVVRRALVTGATGGLGRCLVPALLKAGYQVRATGRNVSVGDALADMGAEFVAADVCEDPLSQLIKNIDVVFHLAALSSPWGTRAVFEAINVTATQRLLSASQDSGVGTFTFASTPSIYAAAYDRLDITEADPPASPFANHYAATKYKAETIVLGADVPGFRTIVLRPRAIVSEYDTVLLPRLLRAVQRGRMPLPNEGRALIELTDARDVVSAFIKADQAVSVHGQAFNISSGEARTLRTILKMILDHLDMPIRFIPISGKVLMGLASCFEAVAKIRPGQPEPLMTTYTAKALAFSQTFDISKAQSMLGWTPQHMPEDAIVDALDAKYA